MSQASIDQLLAGSWVDPASGKPVRLPFRAVAIAPSLDGQEAALVRALDLGRRLAVVCDPDTHRVLGARVVRALESIAAPRLVLLPGHPHADAETVERIRAETAPDDALVAVGSGTINDLCKQASFLDRKPYAVFATAPSMNGYTSTSAAITEHGHKKSLSAHGAGGVFIDLEVLAAAPPHMIRSGLGDSLCRPTAQLDWLLSHRLRGTAYSETPFAIQSADERAMLDGAEGLMRGDLAAMESLARVLVLCGFGMCIAGSSAPASQAEHLISHHVDMLGEGVSRERLGRDALHGEQIGVATLTVARLQERLLQQDRPPRLKPTTVDAAAIRAHFGDSGDGCLAEFRAKALDAAETERVNALLQAEWPAIRDALAARFLPPSSLRRVLERAGAPQRPADLGWSDAFHRDAVRWARRIRNRYTCLDLIDDSVGIDFWLG
ncbi:MAG: iron-containing alcohol dehydrogenase [Alphaproteobacteria bacterium]|nr:iron-containing alcohol dehydrogenase [Alphaproteobacteria bacterium]